MSGSFSGNILGIFSPTFSRTFSPTFSPDFSPGFSPDVSPDFSPDFLPQHRSDSGGNGCGRCRRLVIARGARKGRLWVLLGHPSRADRARFRRSHIAGRRVGVPATSSSDLASEQWHWGRTRGLAAVLAIRSYVCAARRPQHILCQGLCLAWPLVRVAPRRPAHLAGDMAPKGAKKAASKVAAGKAAAQSRRRGPGRRRDRRMTRPQRSAHVMRRSRPRRTTRLGTTPRLAPQRRQATTSGVRTVGTPTMQLTGRSRGGCWPISRSPSSMALSTPKASAYEKLSLNRSASTAPRSEN